jgi:hypothetical protein
MSRQRSLDQAKERRLVTWNSGCIASFADEAEESKRGLRKIARAGNRVLRIIRPCAGRRAFSASIDFRRAEAEKNTRRFYDAIVIKVLYYARRKRSELFAIIIIMIPRGDAVTMRPVLIISFLISMLILGWLASAQLGVLTGGGVSGVPVGTKAVAGPQPSESSSPSPAGPADRARAVSNIADERQREMEEMMNK